jgi:hypothetical protein
LTLNMMRRGMNHHPLKNGLLLRQFYSTKPTEVSQEQRCELPSIVNEINICQRMFFGNTTDGRF